VFISLPSSQIEVVWIVQLSIPDFPVSKSISANAEDIKQKDNKTTMHFNSVFFIIQKLKK
jgi:hypothetical protein